MRISYKIIIIIIITAVGIFMVLPPTMTVILCDDKILNLDDCGDYLEEKYLRLPLVQHFKEMYFAPPGLGFSSDKFKAVKMSAYSILADKIFVFLEIDLNDLTVTYEYQNHNFGDDYLIVKIENPTIEDLDNNDCRTLNQLDNN